MPNDDAPLEATAFDACNTYVENGTVSLEHMSDIEFLTVLCAFYDSRTVPHNKTYTLMDRVVYVNKIIAQTAQREAQGLPTLVITKESSGRLILHPRPGNATHSAA